MKTKEQLKESLTDKGPSFTYSYLFCYYKEVELFQKTGLLKPLLKKMSPEGKARFKKNLKILKKLAESKKDWTDEEYENWSKKHSKNGFSKEEHAAAATNPESLEYKSQKAKDDFYQTCVIRIKDKVCLLEAYGCMNEGSVGTVTDYIVGGNDNAHSIEVRFRVVDADSKKLIGIEDCSVPPNMLKVVERWLPERNKYTKEFDENERVYPNYEPLDLKTVYYNLDTDVYGYPYIKENEEILRKGRKWIKKLKEAAAKKEFTLEDILRKIFK